MKQTLIAFLILLTQNYSLSQNYISYYNHCNEGEYYFYEMDYGMALVYYEPASKMVEMPMPAHQLNFARSLWEVGRQSEAILALEKCPLPEGLDVQYGYFFGMSETTAKDLRQKMTDLRDSIETSAPFVSLQNYIEKSLKLRQQASSPLASSLSEEERKEAYKEAIRLMNQKEQVLIDSLFEVFKDEGITLGKYRMWDRKASYVLRWVYDSLESKDLYLSALENGSLHPDDYAYWDERRHNHANRKNNSKVAKYNQNNAYLDPPLEELFANYTKIGLNPYYPSTQQIFKKGYRPVPLLHFDDWREDKVKYDCTRFSEKNELHFPLLTIEAENDSVFNENPKLSKNHWIISAGIGSMDLPETSMNDYLTPSTNGFSTFTLNVEYERLTTNIGGRGISAQFGIGRFSGQSAPLIDPDGNEQEGGFVSDNFFYSNLGPAFIFQGHPFKNKQCRFAMKYIPGWLHFQNQSKQDTNLNRYTGNALSHTLQARMEYILSEHLSLGVTANIRFTRMKKLKENKQTISLVEKEVLANDCIMISLILR